MLKKLLLSILVKNFKRILKNLNINLIIHNKVNVTGIPIFFKIYPICYKSRFDLNVCFLKIVEIKGKDGLHSIGETYRVCYDYILKNY